MTLESHADSKWRMAATSERRSSNSILAEVMRWIRACAAARRCRYPAVAPAIPLAAKPCSNACCNAYCLLLQRLLPVTPTACNACCK